MRALYCRHPVNARCALPTAAGNLVLEGGSVLCRKRRDAAPAFVSAQTGCLLAQQGPVMHAFVVRAVTLDTSGDRRAGAKKTNASFLRFRARPGRSWRETRRRDDVYDEVGVCARDTRNAAVLRRRLAVNAVLHEGVRAPARDVLGKVSFQARVRRVQTTLRRPLCHC